MVQPALPPPAQAHAQAHAHAHELWAQLCEDDDLDEEERELDDEVVVGRGTFTTCTLT